MGAASTNAKVQSAYQDLTANGQVRFDAAQMNIARHLDDLALRLAAAPKPRTALFSRKKPEPEKGLYIWGGVGRGKSFLMDLFFASVDGVNKRRVHFHEFMDEMHTAIATFRKSAPGTGNADPIAAVVKPVIAETRLLCFDEFHVNDITNAMLLGRLFEKLWDGGVVMVATSNVEPGNLYENGLNRQLVLPFIAALKSHCEVLALDGPIDYRRLKLSGRDLYRFGTGPAIDTEMDELWTGIISGAPDEPGTIRSLGRDIAVPHQAMGAARFDFADLCDAPLGARDYLVIAHRFHTIMLDHVPGFSRANSNAAKRFILFIDTLYARGVKLAASFALPLEELGNDGDTSFEFRRCLSRLIEMRSEDYLARAIADPADLG
ncbi:MAG: AFG1 family ATPase [Hyphomicrobiaceae bacterium]|nr:AFG1 family ATPase [Hyphomicrobiaceae bacterium]MCC0024319.1 cell division protein ZapE [Hyphomicrobiaceae bacterium]